MQAISEFIKRTIEIAIEIFFAIFITILGGIVIGLGLYLGIMFAYYGLYWVLGVSCFMSIFHLDDLKEFFVKRNFVAIIGRFVCIYAISSFICGYIAYASGAYSIKTNSFTDFAALFSFPVSFIGVGIVYITFRYLRYSPLYYWFERTVEKLKDIGILWTY